MRPWAGFRSLASRSTTPAVSMAKRQARTATRSISTAPNATCVRRGVPPKPRRARRFPLRVRFHLFGFRRRRRSRPLRRQCPSRPFRYPTLQAHNPPYRQGTRGAQHLRPRPHLALRHLRPHLRRQASRAQCRRRRAVRKNSAVRSLHLRRRSEPRRSLRPLIGLGFGRSSLSIRLL